MADDSSRPSGIEIAVNLSKNTIRVASAAPVAAAHTANALTSAEQEIAPMPEALEKRQRDTQKHDEQAGSPRKRSKTSSDCPDTSSDPNTKNTTKTTNTTFGQITPQAASSPEQVPQPQASGARTGLGRKRATNVQVHDHRSVTPPGATVSEAYLTELDRQAEAGEMHNLNETIVFRSGSELRRILVERAFARGNEQPQQLQQPQVPVRYPRKSLANKMLSDKAYRCLGKRSSKLSEAVQKEHEKYSRKLEEQERLYQAKMNKEQQRRIQNPAPERTAIQRQDLIKEHDVSVAGMIDQKAFIDQCYEALGGNDKGYINGNKQEPISRKTADIALAAWKTKVKNFEDRWVHAFDEPWTSSVSSHPGYPGPPSAPEEDLGRGKRNRKPINYAPRKAPRNGRLNEATDGQDSSTAKKIATQKKGRSTSKPASGKVSKTTKKAASNKSTKPKAKKKVAGGRKGAAETKTTKNSNAAEKNAGKDEERGEAEAGAGAGESG